MQGETLLRYIEERLDRSVPTKTPDIKLTREELINWVVEVYNPTAQQYGFSPIRLFDDNHVVNELQLMRAFQIYNTYYIHNRQPPAEARSAITGIALVPEAYRTLMVRTKMRDDDPFIPAVYNANPTAAPTVSTQRQGVMDAETSLRNAFKNLAARWRPDPEPIGIGEVRELP